MKRVHELDSELNLPYVEGCRICRVLANLVVPAPPRPPVPMKEWRKQADIHFDVDHDVFLMGYGHHDGAERS